MDTTQLSKTIQRQSEEYGMTIEEMAYATLTNNGWTPHDAAKLLELVQPNASTSSIKFRTDKIIAKEGYTRFINGENYDDNSSIADINARKSGKKLRDKDAVLKAMEKEADQMTGLDKIRALKEIAELQQMKKETNKDKEELVKFFLPLTCHNCSLFIRNQNKK